jgi:hypothetical protein
MLENKLIDIYAGEGGGDNIAAFTRGIDVFIEILGERR